MEEHVELVSLHDDPAKLGTKWEQNADRLGKRLVTLNTCNIYEKDKKFGWKSEKPFPAQVTLLLEPKGDSTRLSWMIESEEVGIVQLAEPLLIKQTNEMIQKSLVRFEGIFADQETLAIIPSHVLCINFGLYCISAFATIFDGSVFAKRAN